MHWWRGAKSHNEAGLVHSGGGRSPLKTTLFSRRNRARKLQHLIDNGADSPVRSSSVSVVASEPCPQPLPLPELHIPVEPNDKLDSSPQSYNVPLQSPEEVNNAIQGGGDKTGVRDIEKEIERDIEKEREGATELNAYAIDGLNAPKSRSAGQHVRRKSENFESSSSQSILKQNGIGLSSDISHKNFPTSAPTSPHSSPKLSPVRNDVDFFETHYMTPPGAFQISSAPEMPRLDTHLSARFLYQMSSENTTSNVLNSPLHSPQLSTLQAATSPKKHATQLHKKTSPKTQLARHEFNAQANVHPLPLPPGAAISSQSSPSFPVAAKPEFLVASMPSHPTPTFPLTAKTEFQATTLPLQPIPISLGAGKREWQKGKLIGRGTFGSVYIASNRETGALCAMKEVAILPDDPKSTECARQLEQEIKVLSRLKHQNIVQYYGSEVIGDRFYIYLEYVHPGSINKFVHDHCRAITESVVRNFTHHILCGLAYLHSTKIIHRDIKGANLLVDAFGVVKLADFGMAKHLTGYAANLSLKGSPYWMAPELLQSVTQTGACSDIALAMDIWSLGCTIIEMFSGKPPWSEYEGAAALFKVLKDSPPIPETLSAEGKDFLYRCFYRNPADRPTARMLLEHPFVKYLHQPDALSYSRLTGNTQRHTQLTKGKLTINEIGLQRHQKMFSFTKAPLYSPRSTLEADCGLSPPR